MSKLDLIIALKNETGITKSDAEAVVNLFFNEMSMHLPLVTGLKSGDCARFMSSNTGRTPVGIRRLGHRFRLNPKNCHFSSVGRN